MATIRNQRNSERLVLTQDNAPRDRELGKAVAPGRFYLPSVSPTMFLQSPMSRGCKHGTTRHPDHASTKQANRLAWSGCSGLAGLRAASTTLSVN